MIMIIIIIIIIMITSIMFIVVIISGPCATGAVATASFPRSANNDDNNYDGIIINY